MASAFSLDLPALPGAGPATAPLPAPAADAPLAGVIDIGSNSIRLVVYRGARRAPSALFNEKVMAGLGAGVAAGGRLDPAAAEQALNALARFAMVARAMGVAQPRTVATAAVRDAADGLAFVAAIEARTGLVVEVIDGDIEARGSAYGVIASVPGADGVVGDLGGGSLELVRVHSGRPFQRVSLPIGSLRLVAAQRGGRALLRRLIARMLDGVPWLAEGAGRPFYMVGGSWRALAHLHMAVTRHPLPVIHQYSMPAEAPDRLVRTLAQMAPRTLRAMPGIAAARVAALPGAAMLLAAVVERLGASACIASAWGLREGLLFLDLPAEQRLADPLLAAARVEGARLGRFPATGEALVPWTRPLFAADPPAWQRLRAAAALLSDSGWSANPDFRAERAADVALHGPWVGIAPGERVLLAAALFACFGGDEAALAQAPWRTLADEAGLARARAWGLALRLGQRLGGGAPGPLFASRLEVAGARLELILAPQLRPLAGAAVQRRLKALANALGLEPSIP